jgi:putative phosphoesterase
MQFAIISDIHGNLPALEAVLEDIASLGVEEIYHLGDLVGYNPFPDEVATRVKELGLPGVVGNYDLAVAADAADPIGEYLNPAISEMAKEIYRWTRARLSDATTEYLLTLPERLTLDLGDWRVLLTHGSPRHVREYLRPRLTDAELLPILAGVEAQVIFTGHTHIPMVRRVEQKLLVNPGSVGFPKDGDPRASYALVNVGRNFDVEIRRVPYDIDQAVGALLAAGLPVQAAQDLHYGRRLKKVS